MKGLRRLNKNWILLLVGAAIIGLTGCDQKKAEDPPKVETTEAADKAADKGDKKAEEKADPPKDSKGDHPKDSKGDHPK